MRDIFYGRIFILISIFFIPINKPIVNIFMAAAIASTIISRELKSRLIVAISHPIAWGFIGWALFIIISNYLHSTSIPTLDLIGKNIWLIYPIIVFSLFNKEDIWYERGRKTLMISIGMIVLISWGKYLSIIPQREITELSPGLVNTVFKDYTQQGLEVLVMSSLLASRLIVSNNIRNEWKTIVALALSLLSIFIVTQSRTSISVCLILIIAWIFMWLNLKSKSVNNTQSLLFKLLICAGIITLLIMTALKNQRFLQMPIELASENKIRNETSIGIRLELWRQSIEIIKKSPMFGHGTGQWKSEFEKQTSGFSGYEAFKMDHPHQEYLWITAEYGIFGLSIFLVLIFKLYKYVSRLKVDLQYFYISIIIIYCLSALFNNLLIDFTHRHLFIMTLACIPFLSATKITSNAKV